MWNANQPWLLETDMTWACMAWHAMAWKERNELRPLKQSVVFRLQFQISGRAELSCPVPLRKQVVCLLPWLHFYITASTLQLMYVFPHSISTLSRPGNYVCLSGVELESEWVIEVRAWAAAGGAAVVALTVNIIVIVIISISNSISSFFLPGTRGNHFALSSHFSPTPSTLSIWPCLNARSTFPFPSHSSKQMWWDVCLRRRVGGNGCMRNSNKQAGRATTRYYLT